MAKNGQVHEGGKIGRSSATPTKLFSVDFFNLKSLSFTFCTDIFITFEMPRSFFLMENQPFIGIPSICIRGPCIATKQYKFSVS